MFQQRHEMFVYSELVTFLTVFLAQQEQLREDRESSHIAQILARVEGRVTC